MNARRGLTLIEMLVVLAILVALAGIAITATEGLIEQSRYDATQRTLSGVEDAILGPPGQRLPDGTPWISGFVADVGRLPRVSGTDPATALQEFWLPPAGVPAFSIATPAGDPEVRVPGGWRGPYLRIPIGASKLLDGWGKVFEFRKADGTVAADPGDATEIVSSLGADGAAGGTGYDEDLSVVIARTTAPAVSPRHQGAVPVRVIPSSAAGAGANVVVRIYGPVDGAVRTISQQVFLGATGEQAWTFSDIAVGPRVVRAYQTNEDPSGTPDAPLASATHRTPPVSLAVIGGGLPEILLEPK